jgi:thioesterase domain-containing protein
MYRNLLPYLPSDQPVYGLQAVGMEGDVEPLRTIEAIADHQLKEIRAVQTKGPYFLCGYSMGGKAAIEIARRLRKEYGEVAHVFIVDTFFRYPKDFGLRSPRSIKERAAEGLSALWFLLFKMPARYRGAYLRQQFRRVLIALHLSNRERQLSEQEEIRERKRAINLPEIEHIRLACAEAGDKYVPEPYPWPITFIYAIGGGITVEKMKGLYSLAAGELELHEIMSKHLNMMSEPSVRDIGAFMTAWLQHYQSAKS